MKYILVLTVLLLISTSLHSEENDGNELLSQCNETIRYLDGATEVDIDDGLQCLNYLHGLNDALRVWQAVGNTPITCLPPALSNGQAARVLVVYAKNHPAILHQVKSLVAIMAYQDSFPCEDL